MLQVREEPQEFKLYHYDPSVIAAVVFAILFLLSSLWHFWQLIRHRTWSFIAFIIGALCKPDRL